MEFPKHTFPPPLPYLATMLGAIAEQSVAGATQTSTHGTGRDLGSMSTQIVGLTFVLANGTVVNASATRNTDLFNAWRVGLGALGVVVGMELRVRPVVP